MARKTTVVVSTPRKKPAVKAAAKTSASIPVDLRLKALDAAIATSRIENTLSSAAAAGGWPAVATAAARPTYVSTEEILKRAQAFGEFLAGKS